jgi:hypothetical protein
LAAARRGGAIAGRRDRAGDGGFRPAASSNRRRFPPGSVPGTGRQEPSTWR